MNYIITYTQGVKMRTTPTINSDESTGYIAQQFANLFPNAGNIVVIPDGNNDLQGHYLVASRVANFLYSPSFESRSGAVPVACESCDWTGTATAADYTDIRDLHARVLPGEPVPYRECPECRSLCHPPQEAESE